MSIPATASASVTSNFIAVYSPDKSTKGTTSIDSIRSIDLSDYQEYLASSLESFLKPEKLQLLLKNASTLENYSQCDVLITLISHFPPLINKVSEIDAWIPFIMTIENDSQGIIICELINRGMINKPQAISQYAALWQPPLIMYATSLDLDTPPDEEKAAYEKLLLNNLEAQSLTQSGLQPGISFYAPIIVIDLNTSERFVLPAEFRLIDNNRILVIAENFNGEVKAGVYNPKDISSIKRFFREAFPQEAQYLRYYFPKLTYSASGWEISIDYARIDTFKENVLGKITWVENYTRASDRFKTTYTEEDTAIADAKQMLADLLPPETLEDMRQEPPLSPADIFTLMFAMRLSSCDHLAPAAFGLSKDEYKSYEARVYALLERDKPVSREEFLVEAIQACDGRAALAAVISYNILFKMGEICYNSLFTAYPNTFSSIEDIQDQAGSIYHFFGCFFSAYALQRWLVEPYNTDTAFRRSIDESAAAIELNLASFYNPDEMTAEKLFANLQYIQYRMLKIGNLKMKEILTLTGIFYEEVLCDRDITWEVKADFKGSSTGYAAYELVSGNSLEPNHPPSLAAFLRNAYVYVLTTGAKLIFD